MSNATAGQAGLDPSSSSNFARSAGAPGRAALGAGREFSAPSVFPPLSVNTILGILRERGVPDDEARQLIESDPRLRAQLAQGS